LKEIAFISIILGITSSIFDFMFFAIFFHAAPAVLQTNWFIESTLTELALIFSIRTRLPFFRAKRPSWVLIGLALLVASITIILPFTHIGQTWFHFDKPSIPHLQIIGAIVLAYFVTTEIVKLLYVRLSGNGTQITK
jgi:Mg2+-importing ATPase